LKKFYSVRFNHLLVVMASAIAKLVVLPLLLQSIAAQYVQTTTVSGNDALWEFSSAGAAETITVSSTPAAAQPTFVWNCQQMPYICANVQQWLDRQGLTLGAGGMEFAYDMNGACVEVVSSF
jgi:hypothetical protein